MFQYKTELITITYLFISYWRFNEIKNLKNKTHRNSKLNFAPSQQLIRLENITSIDSDDADSVCRVRVHNHNPTKAIFKL